MIRNSYLSKEELGSLGFKSIGENVSISRRACFYGTDAMELGSNIRIDDFCIFTGKVKIGNYIHIAPYTSLCGGEMGIFLEDFVNLSRKIEIFALSDDFSGRTLTSPMVPAKYKGITHAPVLLKKHVVVGAASVILPGVTMEEGSAVGAMSLVNRNTESWSIYAGIPAIKIKQRKRDLLDLERKFYEENQNL